MHSQYHTTFPNIKKGQASASKNNGLLVVGRSVVMSFNSTRQGMEAVVHLALLYNHCIHSIPQYEFLALGPRVGCCSHLHLPPLLSGLHSAKTPKQPLSNNQRNELLASPMFKHPHQFLKPETLMFLQLTWNRPEHNFQMPRLSNAFRDGW